ncbi:MAG TPA: lactate racemase domain-containing protein, partial [Pirellulales bacterium]|nr:lactate racemase domain-containing protein [Pirellulales bacterium]
MTTTLHYGLDSRLALDFPPGVLVEHCAAPAVPATHDSVTAARQALEQPVGFPPLAEAIVPGDHVTIAVEAAVPEADAIVAAVVQCIERAGANAEDVTVLRTHSDTEAGADPRRLLPPELRDRVKLETHDPNLRDQLGYLANTQGGRPIYLHRALCDADLVVLVGCMRSREALAYHGI